VAHRTIKSSYDKLVERLNRAPQGAPPSALLNRILSLLMSEHEAELVSLLPIKPFTARQAAGIWKISEAAARTHCETLASRALLVDVERQGTMIYVLPPPMAGFFEFALMRVRHDLDQKLLSELLYQYLNVEEDFVKDLFTKGETKLGRVFVQEPVLTSDLAVHVLDYERASEVIETASHIGVGLCYCRHKKEHLGEACSMPMDICMTFNSAAESLTRHGHGRAIEAAECRDLLDQAHELGLVQFGENVQKRVSFICHCCGCCCEALLAHKQFTHLHPVHTSNWIPAIDTETCNGCGRCVRACPVDALSLPPEPRTRPAAAVLDTDACLGCGVCVRACSRDALKLEARSARVITPLNNAHRYVLMATQRGKLQDLIFDNRILASHRALAALLGAVLKLPGVTQTLARRQLNSRYLEAMAAKMDH